MFWATGFLFRAEKGDGSKPLGTKTLRDSCESFRGYIPDDLVDKLRKLHGGRLGSVYEIISKGGSITEALWSGNWVDVKMIMRYFFI